MTPNLLNSFHDWLSTRLSFSNDLVLGLEITTADGKVQSANIAFSGFRDLRFKDYQQKQWIETEDLETIRKLSLHRWIQRSIEVEGGIEIEFIGGNDFTDSHVGAMRFNYRSVLVTINDEECLTKSAVERMLESF